MSSWATVQYINQIDRFDKRASVIYETLSFGTLRSNAYSVVPLLALPMCIQTQRIANKERQRK
ncbi:hypothetical protein M378DRAFT_168345, partial [Amanita muscaria Koide BX008]